MSDVMFNVRDARRSLHARIHGSAGDRIVAALSADPETIEELDAAEERFVRRDPDHSFFAAWKAGDGDSERGEGLCIVDLAAQLVVCESSYSSPGSTGKVAYHNGRSATSHYLPYHIAESWKFQDRTEGWREEADERRRMRAQAPPFDSREVLYERLLPYIADEVRAARDAQVEDPIVEVHRKWLLTPRDDLRGQAPRDILLAAQDHIAADLEDREFQWGQMDSPPPGIDWKTAAYRFGGFGIHEWVLYYTLVRHLLRECWEHSAQEPDATPQAVCRRLDQAKNQWLTLPQRELHDFCPAELIDHERRRIPIVVPAEKTIIDHDCPLCQMMAEECGPAFWHLDGCHMEDEFAFSTCDTQEEWEEEFRDRQAEFEQWSAEVDLERLQQVFGDCTSPGAVGLHTTMSPWNRSFAMSDVGGAEESLDLVLFDIGAHLAELDLELKKSHKTTPHVETLNRQFGNLRETVRSSPDLVEPVVQRFQEQLEEVADEQPDLLDKCADLEVSLREIAERVTAAQFDQ